MLAAIRSNSAKGTDIAGSAHRTGTKRASGPTVIFGATSPSYSIPAREPSGSSTVLPGCHWRPPWPFPQWRLPLPRPRRLFEAIFRINRRVFAGSVE